MNVVLIGYRCSGKSTVGRRLAERLSREFIDCDDYIEKKTELTIREIFELHGESHFRSLESRAIGELAKLDGKIIATGGGAVLKYKNMQALKRNGRVFWLDVRPDTACRRLLEDPKTGERRPSLTGKEPGVEIREQLEFRRPYYRKGAHVTVQTDGREIEAILADILRDLGEFEP